MSEEIPGLPITQDWTVTAVKEGKTEPNPKAPGNLTKFYVHFIGDDGTDAPDVYWRRKEGNAPEVNAKVNGTISQGQYGPIFKITTTGGISNFNAGGGNSAAKDDYWAAKEQRDIDGIKRMGRAHAQEMALRMVEATRDAGDLDLTDSDLVGIYLNDVVRKLTDWFENDVNRSV
jgi:hypothetical protein